MKTCLNSVVACTGGNCTIPNKKKQKTHNQGMIIRRKVEKTEAQTLLCAGCDGRGVVSLWNFFSPDRGTAFALFTGGSTQHLKYITPPCYFVARSVLFLR